MADGSRSSPQAAKAWVRFVMPSAADLMFVAILTTLVFTPISVRLLGDAGIGWHIRTGQQIVASNAIPHVDLFSSTMAGRPWFAWEWLYDVVVGQLEASLGLNGVVWFTAVVIASTFAWLFRLLVARGANILVALVLVMLALSASMIHCLARPHVVSWLFTLTWFWILASAERDCFDPQQRSGTRKLWALPLLMLVWANVHGGFLVGFVLLAFFLAGAVWRWFRATDVRIDDFLQNAAVSGRVRTLTLVGLLSMAASLVNPYGWKLYAHIYSYLSNRFLMDHIDEFQSPNFHGLAQKCFLLLLLVTVAVVTVKGRDLRLSGVLVLLFAVYSGFYAARNIPISSLLIVMLVGPLLPASRSGRGFSQRMSAVELSLRGHLWPILAIAATLTIAANGGRAGSSKLMDAHFNPKRMPVDAVNYLERSASKGAVLSTDSWGGYLIYRHPKVPVVVDDRHDLYGANFFQSYLTMMHVERGWQEFLESHEFSYVLLPRDSALTSMLIGTQGWRSIYADDVSIVFVRDLLTR